MIEYLTHETLEEALDFAEKSHGDSAWKDFPFKRDILRVNLQKMIGNEQFFTCMYRKDGVLVGYFFARLGYFLFSDRLLGLENGIYITPEHRGGRIGYRMFHAYLEWCRRQLSEPLIDVYFGEDKDNEKTYSFLRKLGMIECGRSFRGGNHGLRESD